MVMRRQVVKGLAAAGLLGPAWLRAAFAAEVCKPQGFREQELGQLSAAYKAAAAARRPLLVFVVPSEVPARQLVARAFGEWLNHGSDEDLAPLAGVGLVVAGMDSVRTLIPHVGPGEPLLVWVDTARVPAGVGRLAGPIPHGPALDEDVEGEVDLRIHFFGEWARKMAGAVKPEDVKERAAQVRAAVAKGPIAGAHWASSSGCGSTVEVDGKDSSFELVPRGGQEVAQLTDLRVKCGMGYVSERSKRFLLLFPVVAGERR